MMIGLLPCLSAILEIEQISLSIVEIFTLYPIVLFLYKGTSNPFTCLFEQIQNIKDYLFTRCFISMIRNCLGYPLSLFVMKRNEKTYFAQYLLWQRFSVFLQCWQHEEYILKIGKHTQNTQESQRWVILRSTFGVNQPWH